MGSVISHRGKARHNERFLDLVKRNDSIQNPTFGDWMVTVAFYVALHYVDSRLATLGTTPEERHPGNHAQRNTAVATLLPKPLSRDYLYLKSKSEYARYFPDSERRIPPRTVQQCINLALSRFR